MLCTRRGSRQAAPGEEPGALRPGEPTRETGDHMTAREAESLPIAGLQPTFRHLDDPDVTWQKVRRQRNADGSEGTVRGEVVCVLT